LGAAITAGGALAEENNSDEITPQNETNVENTLDEEQFSKEDLRLGDLCWEQILALDGPKSKRFMDDPRIHSEAQAKGVIRAHIKMIISKLVLKRNGVSSGNVSWQEMESAKNLLAEIAPAAVDKFIGDNDGVLEDLDFKGSPILPIAREVIWGNID
jgi:hypothetical protein